MHQIEKRRLDLGLSIAQLAARTGLAALTIYNIEGGSRHSKVHESVAYTLAEYFKCKIEDLFDKYEVTGLGRPAKTGGPITSPPSRNLGICQDCWIELPSSGVCSDCNE